MRKKNTRANELNREIRESLKDLCELILADRLRPPAALGSVEEAYFEGAKIGNALMLYRKLYGRPDTEVKP